MQLRSVAAAFLPLLLFIHGAPAATPPPWAGIPIVDYNGGNPAQLAALKRLGISAVKVLGERQAPVARVALEDAPIRAAGLGCYVENIATDFYSPYHRWFPDHPVNYRFTAAQAAYRADPSGRTPLMRDPSLSDPAWLGRIEARLAAHVRVMQRYRPLWFDMADEAGIADLSAFWDFDVSPDSLAAFRAWLRAQYGSLAALNAEWGSHFARWDAVQPWTTRQAMAAPPGDLAPWADFKAFMDAAFARAVRAGTDAVHRANPDARAALEGGQVPGWGGYDYALLAPAVDVMEIYDADQDMALLQAFNPHALPAMTNFGADSRRMHVLWHGLLDGARAVVIWDDPPLVGADAQPTPRGQAEAPVFGLLRGRVGAALAAARPVYDPVTILYSPASFRLEWMIENRAHPDAWMQGSAEADSQGVAPRTALQGYAQSLHHFGLRPRFVSDAQLAAGVPPAVRVMILPHQAALSDAELIALRTFVRRGGTIITDAPFGLADLHGRFRPQPSSIPAQRISAANRAALSAALAAAHVVPRFRTGAADAEIRVFRLHGRWLVAVQRDFTADAAPEQVRLALPARMAGRDLIPGTSVAPARSLTLKLDTVTPALLDLSPAQR